MGVQVSQTIEIQEDSMIWKCESMQCVFCLVQIWNGLLPVYMYTIKT